MAIRETPLAHRRSRTGIGLLLMVAISLCGAPLAMADDPVPAPTPAAINTTSTPAADAPIITTATPTPSPSATAAAEPLASMQPSPSTRTPASTETPVSTETPADRVAAPLAAGTISGVLTEAQTTIPVPNSCVGWRSTSADSAEASSYAAVNTNGQWSIPVDDGLSYFLFFYATGDGDCVGPVVTTSYLPSWYANVAFDEEVMPAEAREPEMVTLDKVSAGEQPVVACLGTDKLPQGADACAPAAVTLSGRVVGAGPTPINQACVYVFADTDGKDMRRGSDHRFQRPMDRPWTCERHDLRGRGHSAVRLDGRRPANRTTAHPPRQPGNCNPSSMRMSGSTSTPPSS